MKTLYLECAMGAAGDMLAAALLELLPDQDAFLAEMNGLGIPGVHVKKEKAIKCGISGTKLTVTVGGQEEVVSDHHDHAHAHAHDHNHAHGHGHDHAHDHTPAGTHSHTGMHEINHIVEGLAVPNKVRKNVMAVYELIAEAESRAHDKPVSMVHFHEVGAMDAVADITAVCLLMDKIAPEQVIVSPVHVGSGQVRCAHGILPVPTPATAHILKDVPIYGGRIKGELCTPTGAALLKHFADLFGEMPVMDVKAIGYGMGTKDFEAVNCVRAFLGEIRDSGDVIYELNCNVDDMTAEEIGFAMDRLFDAGALDVFTTPIGMKKSRPGSLINILCKTKDKQDVISAAFKYTTTLGLRETACNRHVLKREITVLETPFGQVRRKDAKGYGVNRSKYEYEDLAGIAKETGLSIKEVVRRIEKDKS